MNDHDIIIVIDDDRIYNNFLIERFLHYHKEHPNTVLCGSGCDINRLTNNIVTHNTNKKLPRGNFLIESGYVDILEGCCGFLLNKKLCPFNHNEIFSLNPKDVKYYVDDVWFSGFLTVNNIAIYMIKNEKDETRSINNDIYQLCDRLRLGKNVECVKYFTEKYNIWTSKN